MPSEEEYREYIHKIAIKSGTKIFEYWNNFITKGKLPSYEWLINNVFIEAELKAGKRDGFGLGRYGRLQTPCEALDIFQFYSEEFIEHIAESINKLNPKRIIEIGAGDGFLSSFLRMEGIDIIPIDDHSRPFIKHQKQVEKLNHKEALEKYNPDLVVINWEDLYGTYSIDVLEYPSVKSLLWIGEGPEDCTGSEELWEFDCDDTENPYCLARTDSCMFNFKIEKHTYVLIFYPTKTDKNVFA